MLTRNGALRTESTDGLGRLLLPNAAHDVALRMRSRGKKVPLPDKWVDPTRKVEEDGVVSWLCPRWAPLPGAMEGADEEGVDDQMVVPPADVVDTSLVLRGYQRSALLAWWHGSRNGVIVAPCGAGKTAMGCAAVAHLPTPALVLVHTGDLLRQWKERAAEVGIPCETVSEGQGPVQARMVVATMQTLCGWDAAVMREFGAQFGLVIVDEVHHVPCTSISDVLMHLPGRYRLGLSATPERSDGLTNMIFWHMGPVVSTVSRADLIAAGVTIAPRVRRVDTGWALPTTKLGMRGLVEEGDAVGEEVQVEFGEMVTAATEDEGRNQVLIAAVEELIQRGRHVLVQTERVEHSKYLAAELTARGVSAVAVYGALSPKRRTALLASVGSGAVRVLVATQLADEGLDLPVLDALVIGVPQRNAARLEQRVGRISRAHPGKVDAEVVDLVDDGKKAKRLWNERRVVYFGLGCDVQPGRVSKQRRLF